MVSDVLSEIRSGVPPGTIVSDAMTVPNEVLIKQTVPVIRFMICYGLSGRGSALSRTVETFLFTTSLQFNAHCGLVIQERGLKWPEHKANHSSPFGGRLWN
jgi:hypothetical protein